MSWQPGLGDGVEQSFHVYFTKDHVCWSRRDVTDGLTSVNVTGLLQNMDYFFRVVPSNEFRLVVNESDCENMVFGKTEQGKEIVVFIYL